MLFLLILGCNWIDRLTFLFFYLCFFSFVSSDLPLHYFSWWIEYTVSEKYNEWYNMNPFDTIPFQQWRCSDQQIKYCCFELPSLYLKKRGGGLMTTRRQAPRVSFCLLDNGSTKVLCWEYWFHLEKHLFGLEIHPLTCIITVTFLEESL